MKSVIPGLAVLFICAFTIFAFGAEVYVSPTGSDAAAGTAAAPLATLAAARDKADALKANNTPVTVFLRGGTYYLSAPVVFGPANSGTATAPIIYTAFPGEKPVISGGIKVAPAWTNSSKANIMVTTIATGLKVDQLFLNGTRQVLARFPNYNANTVILNGYDANCIAASRVSTWAAPGEGPGYLRGIDANNWGGSSYFITGKSGTTATTKWVGDNNRVSAVDPTHRMVENIFEELDAAGEWFYRKSTGQLFFWPPAGTNLGTATIELASLDELFRFVGTSAKTDSSVKYIEFKGIAFTQAYRTLFSRTYEPVLKSDWCVARAGTIFMQNAEHIRIERCLFDQVGGNGIFMSGYNRSHVIYNNVFNDAGASCVVLMGLASSVRCPNSYQNAGTCNDHTPGPVDPVNGEFPEFITVDNNMMANLGRFEKQPAGIALSATLYDTLRHNTIHDCPRAGICFCSGCWGGHIVEFNWIYNNVLETGDHGPFNAWGRDRNERWQSDTSATTLDAWKTTIVRYNRFETSSGFGIDLDDQASNYYQFSNLLLGAGLKVQWNRYNTAINNILTNNANTQITGVWWGSNDYLTRNIYTNGSPYYCNFFSPIPTAVLIADTIAKHIKLLDSNLYASGTGSIATEKGGCSWTDWQNAGLDKHSVKGDPIFVNPNQTWQNYAPKGNYQVSSNSPALNVGFKNFPMDSFGVMPVLPTQVQSPYVNARNGLENVYCMVRYNAGILIVSQPGDYRVTITNASGRTVKACGGKGNSRFAFRDKMYGSGVYIASVRSGKGVVTQKFLVH